MNDLIRTDELFIDPTYQRTPVERRSPAQKLYDAEVLERVKKGIALLEAEHGPGWVDHIDLRGLELDDGSACVLGQLYADDADRAGGEDGYDYGLRVLDIERVDKDYGFSATTGADDAWDALQQCWEDELTALKDRRP